MMASAGGLGMLSPMCCEAHWQQFRDSNCSHKGLSQHAAGIDAGMWCNRVGEGRQEGRFMPCSGSGGGDRSCMLGSSHSVILVIIC